MQPFSSEGIILHALNFKDYDKILTVFTPDHGIIKTIVHKASTKGKSPLEPLIHADFVLLKGRSEILKCQEISVKNRYLGLREHYLHLEAACDLIKAVQESQYPDKPALSLYQLLTYSLEKLTQAPHPFALTASFRLKILRHDGLLMLERRCTVCQDTSLGAFHLFGGESYCSQHAPIHAQVFSPDEMQQLDVLIHCRSFGELAAQSIQKPFHDKVKDFFSSCLQNQ